jgi:hypothetical protein
MADKQVAVQVYLNGGQIRDFAGRVSDTALDILETILTTEDSFDITHTNSERTGYGVSIWVDKPPPSEEA